MVVRGEIWLATLPPSVGRAASPTRPCVVVSPAEMHDYLHTVIVAPMVTGNPPAPFRIPVTFQGQQGVILLDQLRTLDKARLVKKMGTVSDKTLAATLATLQAVFAE